jgi:hypothetical protein
LLQNISEKSLRNSDTNITITENLSPRVEAMKHQAKIVEFKRNQDADALMRHREEQEMLARLQAVQRMKS